jgi:hypothetical protein
MHRICVGEFRVVMVLVNISSGQVGHDGPQPLFVGLLINVIHVAWQSKFHLLKDLETVLLLPDVIRPTFYESGSVPGDHDSDVSSGCPNSMRLLKRMKEDDSLSSSDGDLHWTDMCNSRRIACIL